MPRDVRAVFAVFAAALAVRLVHVWQMRDTLFFSVLMGDSRGYDAWARQIAAGDWLGRDVFYQAPLYPYFLGAMYAVVGHDLLVVRIVQALLGATSFALVGYAAARLISPRAGLIAGLMLAFYAPAIFFDGLLQKSVLDVFFVCVSLAIIAQIIADGGTRASWASLGLAMGALALTRENALALIAVITLWAFFYHRGAENSCASTSVLRDRRGPHSSAAVWFVAGVAAILLPVAIRNSTVGGGFYLTTSQLGSNLYIGNSARADGSYVALREGRGSPEFERSDATDLAEQATGRRLTPAEVSSYWIRQTLAEIRRDPAHWLALLAWKARLLVSSTEIIDTESQESHAEYSWPLRVTGSVWHFGLLLPLAIMGACATWSRRQQLWPIYALAATYAASVILFFVVARYRLPLVPLLIVLAAAGLTALIGSRRAVSKMTLAAVVIVATAANWPLHTAASQQAITENNLGAALYETGRPDEAIARYQRALALDPNYTPALNNLGAALRSTGRVDEALRIYDRAIAGGSPSASVYINRGNALMARGALSQAIASFRQAVAADRASRHARTTLARALYDYGTAAMQAAAFDRAIAALAEAVQLTPDYAEAHNNLGVALASQGRLDEAIREWETALRLAPTLGDARRNVELARRTREVR